ncbi:MAG: hypothetical protein HOB84_14995 [Candidatus Marinimicrobia bacterium]|jgi:hypothetical protein|nr:hypothetical protein [Candidatus Neomarinimicrobiota bacterium]MBT4033276.1 hypothetical protein [Candidatus Neomarinimicrobiota bacterium]MBT4361989.1 hypothetical protein [Candidatus Neomarinimicrobiota bacterium]MBT4716074.1 hypothetical protein [Candidatus Neomarinimicrobiota bacterium]MBT4945942.1 hypothetical protein [Candidatus Neomarinimicrobiota bacterium]
MFKCNHATKHLSIGIDNGEVDVKIYELVKEIWEAGIKMVNACESDENDRVFLAFYDSEETQSFLRIINSDVEEDDSLSERSICQRPDLDDNWNIGVGIFYPGDNSQHEEIHIGLSAHFPKSDYDEVLRRVKEHNK